MRIKETAKQNGVSAYSLDHYSAMSYGWNRKLGYQLILFDQHNHLPKRYWCDQTIKEWKEIIDETDYDSD